MAFITQESLQLQNFSPTKRNKILAKWEEGHKIYLFTHLLSTAFNETLCDLWSICHLTPRCPLKPRAVSVRTFNLVSVSAICCSVIFFTAVGIDQYLRNPPALSLCTFFFPLVFPFRYGDMRRLIGFAIRDIWYKLGKPKEWMSSRASWRYTVPEYVWEETATQYFLCLKGAGFIISVLDQYYLLLVADPLCPNSNKDNNILIQPCNCVKIQIFAT